MFDGLFKVKQWLLFAIHVFKNITKFEFYISLLISAFCCLLIQPKYAYAQLSSFPGAEGFGADTIGGRGGQIVEVTNVNDSGSGSLRACIQAAGPRTCIFRTGGTIELLTSLTISNPYITIAGQTAPGDGITIKHVTGGNGINIQTHDVIIRYLTIRPGPGGQNQAILIAKNNSDQVYNVIIDHCSLSWATDEIITTWYSAHNVSIQWSVISESLDCSTHPKGCHSKGSLLGGYKYGEQNTDLGAYNLSFHHNLVAQHGERLPMIKTSGLVDITNNVLYNPYWSFSYIDLTSPSIIPVNYVGNYFKRGPNSSSSKYEINVVNNGGSGTNIYVQGNIGPHRTSDTLDQKLVVNPEYHSYVVTIPNVVTKPVNTTSAHNAYSEVLSNAGSNKGLNCNGTFFNRRDTHDSRVVLDVQNATGGIINDPSDVGGWLNLDSGTPCADSDHDGIPDTWEVSRGLNPNNGSDANQTAPSGYTWIEEYINGPDPLQDDSSPTSAPIPGDANGDGRVDGLDYIVWLNNYGSNVSGPANGDFNGDGRVDGLDYIVWLNHYGT